MLEKAQVAIFASGTGSNAETLIRYFQHHPMISTPLVLSNNAQAEALQRAQNLNVNTFVFTKSQLYESNEVMQELNATKITHIVLAGFLWQIPPFLIHSFAHKIVNIHPSLLPKFGGKGMYGMHVHRAVKKAHEQTTGITIHEVNEIYDEGKILFQASCPVNINDTPEQISFKVHRLEQRHFPEIIEKWIRHDL